MIRPSSYDSYNNTPIHATMIQQELYFDIAEEDDDNDLEAETVELDVDIVATRDDTMATFDDSYDKDRILEFFYNNHTDPKLLSFPLYTHQEVDEVTTCDATELDIKSGNSTSTTTFSAAATLSLHDSVFSLSDHEKYKSLQKCNNTSSNAGSSSHYNTKKSNSVQTLQTCIEFQKDTTETTSLSPEGSRPIHSSHYYPRQHYQQQRQQKPVSSLIYLVSTDFDIDEDFNEYMYEDIYEDEHDGIVVMTDDDEDYDEEEEQQKEKQVQQEQKQKQLKIDEAATRQSRHEQERQCDIHLDSSYQERVLLSKDDDSIPSLHSSAVSVDRNVLGANNIHLDIRLKIELPPQDSHPLKPQQQPMSQQQQQQRYDNQQTKVQEQSVNQQNHSGIKLNHQQYDKTTVEEQVRQCLRSALHSYLVNGQGETNGGTTTVAPFTNNQEYAVDDHKKQYRTQNHNVEQPHQHNKQHQQHQQQPPQRGTPAVSSNQRRESTGTNSLPLRPDVGQYIGTKSQNKYHNNSLSRHTKNGHQQQFIENAKTGISGSDNCGSRPGDLNRFLSSNTTNISTENNTIAQINFGNGASKSNSFVNGASKGCGTGRFSDGLKQEEEDYSIVSDRKPKAISRRSLTTTYNSDGSHLSTGLNSSFCNNMMNDSFSDSFYMRSKSMQKAQRQQPQQQLHHQPNHSMQQHQQEPQRCEYQQEVDSKCYSAATTTSHQLSVYGNNDYCNHVHTPQVVPQQQPIPNQQEQHHRRQLSAERQMPGGEQISSLQQVPMVEIFPGVVVELRGAAEATEAIRNDFYMPLLCFCCETTIFCIQDADFVICPECRVVTSTTTTTINDIQQQQYRKGGVGLGFTFTELQRHQAAIFLETNSHRLRSIGNVTPYSSLSSSSILSSRYRRRDDAQLCHI
jgi:hypothetical protein